MPKDIENRQDVELLIRSFYNKVIKDETIGYIFNDVAKVDWDAHLPVMYNFWENVIFHAGTYRGNPMQLHKALNAKEPLTPEHFKQWLALFTATVDALFAGPKAELAKQRALSISTMIQVKIAQQMYFRVIMQNKPPIFNRAFKILIALIAWSAVGLQFYITVHSFASFIFFISFFTVLTNILVAVSFTAQLLLKNNTASLFSKPSTATALTMYILVVGLVYNTILRKLWQPEGLQLIADNLLHTIVPALCLLYWALFVTKGRLHVKYTLIWLVYPAIYLAYTLVRGAITNAYPYPFIDVSKIGYSQTFINAGVMLVVFLVLGLLFTSLPKLFSSRR